MRTCPLIGWLLFFVGMGEANAQGVPLKVVKTLPAVVRATLPRNGKIVAQVRAEKLLLVEYTTGQAKHTHDYLSVWEPHRRYWRRAALILLRDGIPLSDGDIVDFCWLQPDKKRGPLFYSYLSRGTIWVFPTGWQGTCYSQNEGYGEGFDTHDEKIGLPDARAYTTLEVHHWYYPDPDGEMVDEVTTMHWNGKEWK